MPPSGSDRGPLGVYVHFPFCSVRCTYCDFPTVAGRDDRIGAYVDALTDEIGSFQNEAQGAADTVFFGGGTPSRMLPEHVLRILNALRGRFDLDDGAEVTLEG